MTRRRTILHSILANALEKMCLTLTRIRGYSCAATVNCVLVHVMHNVTRPVY